MFDESTTFFVRSISASSSLSAARNKEVRLTVFNISNFKKVIIGQKIDYQTPFWQFLSQE